MENISKFWLWLKALPLWLRSVVLVLLSALALIASMNFCACGVTRAVVHNGADGTSTEIKITTNNPTSVSTSANLNVIPDVAR